MGTVSGSLDIKGEPEEHELKQMKEDDRQSESQQVVKIEVEDISLDENQDAMKQETDTLMGKYSGFPEIKEEPVELEANKVKEEEHGAEHQQMAKIEADGSSQDETQDLLKKETDTLILMASYDETDNQQPELNRNQIFFQNFPKAEDHQEIKTNEASGYSRVERQQKRAQKTRGQSDNVEKGVNEKRIHKEPKNAAECRRPWVHQILQGREQFREYHHLFQELRLDDGRFKRYFRLSRTQFEDLLSRVGRRIGLWDANNCC
ncbi:hypothetical protein CRENBAI_016847 [Crenichthys baileyi]|uniref:Uncharacterized protein n=1 Tax=Crenichthys baileyi TaxID=28760 RepID=A0AAV9SCG1_9TELE